MVCCGRKRSIARRRRARAAPEAPSGGLEGVWDDSITPASASELALEARRLWSSSGGSRSNAASFWVGMEDEPDSLLGKFALEVAHGVDGAAGCEVWVQLRDKTTPNKGLEFHFDKDERALADRDEWRHPVVATATYLTTGGAPLVIFETTPDSASVSGGYAIAPVTGRHVRFAGNRLHGVPAELLQGPAVTRLSVLVNVWRERPLALEPLQLPRDGVPSKRQKVSRPYISLDETKLVDPKFYDVHAGDADLVTLKEHRPGDTAQIPLIALAEADCVAHFRYGPGYYQPVPSAARPD